MLDMNKKKWQKIDKYEEEQIVKGVRYIRPIDDNPVNISCSFCKNLIYTVEDVETMKKKDICYNCYDIYYIINKEKWDKGWRPNKYI